MAEVIRRAFEEVHSERWPEEYEALARGTPAGARAITFGSERPLDDPLAGKSYLAHTFGLFTGSAARWYLRRRHGIFYRPGDGSRDITVWRRIGQPWRSHRRWKRQHTSEVGALLQKDRSLRRFSVLSFDGDLPTTSSTFDAKLSKETSSA